MSTVSQADLARKKCVPCEGNVPPLSSEEARNLLNSVEGWSITEDGKKIRRQWIVKNFMAGMEFLNKVAELAEEQGHHPDIGLQGYRNVSIDMTTHAIGGLSENDFIIAAKINEIPIQLKR